jgi:hypothetical protein
MRGHRERTETQPRHTLEFCVCPFCDLVSLRAWAILLPVLVSFVDRMTCGGPVRRGIRGKTSRI